VWPDKSKLTLVLTKTLTSQQAGECFFIGVFTAQQESMSY